jgi:predicted DNA-binding WGR domain protein
MQSKTEYFKAAAGALLEASGQLVMKCQSRKKKGIEDAVNEVHAKYVSLEKIFD